jgi:phospholipid-binding lipoprotein MlaA
MRRAHSCAPWIFAPVLSLLVAACTAVPRDPSLPLNDPNEATNRRIMAANQEILRPASVIVTAATPGPLHDRLHDFNSNLKEPRIFVNNVLQGRFQVALHTAARLAMNTVFGAVGMFDIATHEGLPQQSGDFGQTLFVWGTAEGPYVVRPWFGPATTRDAIGSTIDMFLDPVGYVTGSQVWLSIATSGLDAIDKLSRLKQAEDASIDFYSFVRSGYYQTRRAELREALGLPSVIDSPALDDPDAPAADAAAEAVRPSPSAK